MTFHRMLAALVLLTTLGAGTATALGQDFEQVNTTSPQTLSNKTLLSPVLTTPTLSSPTITGTISGSPTITSPTLTSPTITGTISGSPTLTSPTITAPTITGATSIGSGATLTSPTINGTVSGTGAIVATGSITPRTWADRFAIFIGVKDENAVGDGVADDRQAFVDTDADTVGTIVCDGGTYLIGSNLTMTSPVMFMDGCILKPAAGVVITLNGGVVASPLAKIFDTTTSATSYVSLLRQTVSPCWWGVIMEDGLDDLAAWNQVVKHINTARIDDVLFPPSTAEFSAEPTTITGGTVTIHGAGWNATVLKMQAGAGTAATFFRLGDAATSVSRSYIHDFGFIYDNFASLGATKGIFDFANTSDCSVERMVTGEGGNGIAGFIKLGDNALGTTASRTSIIRARVLMYGPAEGAAFNVERANGVRVVTVTTTVSTASVTGALRGIWMHPTGGNTTIDSGSWNMVEFNFPGANVHHIVDIDASQGIIINQWFNPGFVADHSIKAAIRIHIDAGAHAAARLNNINFTTIRSYIDGEGSVWIDNSGPRDIGNLSFIGGVLTGFNLAPIRITGTATDRTDLQVVGVNFTDTENITSKAAIDAQGLSSLRVVGNSAASQLTTDANKFTYMVNFTGDVTNFVITGNDCRECTLGVIESTLLGLNNAQQRIVANNNGPNIEYTQRITTTDATVTTLLNIPLLDARVCDIQVMGSGVQAGGTNRASYEILGTFYRTAAGVAVQEGTTTVLHSKASNGAWVFAFAIATNTVQARVTGVAATNIKWGGNVTKFWCLKE